MGKSKKMKIDEKETRRKEKGMKEMGNITRRASRTKQYSVLLLLNLDTIHNTTQHNTTQHNTTQHCTAHLSELVLRGCSD